VCIEWGALAGPDVPRADAAIARLELPDALVQRTVTDAGGYWVYVPPVKTKAQLDRTIGQMSALGITEFFVVEDATPWRNAISLGIFKSEEAARTFLDALRAKGLQSAVTGRRENFLKQIAYFVREPTEATVAKLAELQRDFPGTGMKAVACPGAGA
jgi:cell division septation protein DedD